MHSMLRRLMAAALVASGLTLAIAPAAKATQQDATANINSSCQLLSAFGLATSRINFYPYVSAGLTISGLTCLYFGGFPWIDNWFTNYYVGNRYQGYAWLVYNGNTGANVG